MIPRKLHKVFYAIDIILYSRLLLGILSASGFFRSSLG